MIKLDKAIYERDYVYNFHFHLVWVTKYRHATFTTPALVKEMEEILNYIAELHDITIEKMEVMPDHVHMLISFKPKYSATNVIKALKGGSARIFLRHHPEIKQKQYWGGHLWSRSYYMGTLGNMNKEVVESYIANQRTTKSNAGRPPLKKKQRLTALTRGEGIFLLRLLSFLPFYHEKTHQDLTRWVLMKSQSKLLIC